MATCDGRRHCRATIGPARCTRSTPADRRAGSATAGLTADARRPDHDAAQPHRHRARRRQGHADALGPAEGAAPGRRPDHARPRARRGAGGRAPPASPWWPSRARRRSPARSRRWRRAPRSIPQAERLGTAHAVLAARAALEAGADDVDRGLRRHAADHRRRPWPACARRWPRARPWRCWPSRPRTRRATAGC